MFGVTRQRVMQWSSKYHIKPPPGSAMGMRAVRVWDDSRNRFVPVPRGSFYEGERKSRLITRRQEISKRIRDRRNQMVSKVVELKNVLGRDPTLSEMATVVFGRELKNQKQSGPRLAGVWGGSSSTGQKYQAFRAALREHGVIARKRGSTGRISPRSKKLFCKRGHSAEENKNRFGTCNICRRWTQKAMTARKRGRPIPPEPIELRDTTELYHLGI